MIAYDRYKHVTHHFTEYLSISEVCGRMAGAWLLSLAIFLIYMAIPVYRFFVVSHKHQCICTPLSVYGMDGVTFRIIKPLVMPKLQMMTLVALFLLITIFTLLFYIRIGTIAKRNGSEHQ